MQICTWKMFIYFPNNQGDFNRPIMYVIWCKFVTARWLFLIVNCLNISSKIQIGKLLTAKHFAPTWLALWWPLGSNSDCRLSHSVTRHGAWWHSRATRHHETQSPQAVRLAHRVHQPLLVTRALLTSVATSSVVTYGILRPHEMCC